MPRAPQAGESSPLAAEDQALVERLRVGDETAFLALVERNHRSMVRVAMGHVRSEAVAEETSRMLDRVEMRQRELRSLTRR